MMPRLTLAKLPDENDEEIRNPILLLAKRGYEIFHNGKRLVLNGSTWKWIKP